jgi:hypothetical protein
VKKLATPLPRVALSPPEAAAALGIGPDLFAERVQPHVRLVRVGRRKLVPLAELHRWLDEAADPPMAEQVGGA